MYGTILQVNRGQFFKISTVLYKCSGKGILFSVVVLRSLEEICSEDGKGEQVDEKFFDREKGGQEED